MAKLTKEEQNKMDLAIVEVTQSVAEDIEEFCTQHGLFPQHIRIILSGHTEKDGAFCFALNNYGECSHAGCISQDLSAGQSAVVHKLLEGITARDTGAPDITKVH